MIPPMLDVEGFILVGGQSSRMGTDKSRLVLGGQTTVSLIANALQKVTNTVTLVSSRVGSDAWSLPKISDLHEQWGPLGGIHAALRACKTRYCLIVACDLPFPTGELFAFLLELTSDGHTNFDAVVPLQSDGRPQPLCAVYERIACLTATEESIRRGEHSPRAMLDKVKTRYVDFNEFAHLHGSQYFFFNLNLPEDYERAKEIASLGQNRDHR